MAGHEVLHRELLLAIDGRLPIAPRQVGFAGSYNYGRMRNATAYLAGDSRSKDQARELWLNNEQEQLANGHWTHGDQCEQGCPQPHLEFNLEPALAVLQAAIKRDDDEMTFAAKSDVGRTLALARIFNLDGVVCMPGARAKDRTDPSNKQHVDQWRQRPLDVLLSIVQGRKPIKYGGPAIVMFKQLDKSTIGEVNELSKQPMKLAFPIHYVRMAGRGYTAWIEHSAEAERRLLDPLNAVRIEHAKLDPVLWYNWDKADVPTNGDRQVVGL